MVSLRVKSFRSVINMNVMHGMYDVKLRFDLLFLWRNWLDSYM